MKGLKLTALLLALLTLTACAMARTAENADTYLLYYATDPVSAQGGDAVAPAAVVIEDSGQLEKSALAEALLKNLLQDPAELALRRVIPKGTSLLSVTLDGSRATVDLSAAYGTLSGIALTLADYCITLTLTQLPEIVSVVILVQGQELAYRDSQRFRARDALLSSKEDVISTVEAALYFVDEESGSLTAEARTLEIYEGETQADCLLRELMAGPREKGLLSPLPPDFAVLSIWTENSICYLNLSGEMLDAPVTPAAARKTVDALVRSLCSLDTVETVQMMADGEIRASYGGVAIDGLLQPAQ
ncbi:MAG: GerMN domain-containing protein [Oscillospiraceae bacterium]